ncbi:MAG: hypothetical protein IJM02_07085 [Clostridia bacterium]|nr:hypothetical protein [Clostridia bacterium]
MKKLLSVFTALCIVLSAGIVFSSAQSEVKTTCGGEGECDCVPTIVIPGIGQSQVYLVDDEGNFVYDEDGDKINCFPAYFNVKSIVKRVLAPALISLASQHDIGLSKALCKVVDDCFYMNTCDSEGNPSPYGKLEEYPYSLAQCSQEEKNIIYGHIPLQGYSEIAGEDHLYYFAYNSFGNNIQIVDRLYEYIEMVKAETGHDKVNIAPISLGGTVANGLLEYYSGRYEGKPCVYESLNKIVYIVPAVDGSSIVGDVMGLDLAFLNPDYLYNGFLEGLMDEKTARGIEILLRILPDDMLMSVLNKVCEHLAGSVIAYSTNMWALVPSENYPACAEKWLSSPEMAKIKEQTDLYYTAQVNRFDNLAAAQEAGAKAFNIVDYGVPLYNVGNSWNKENADGVIDLDSTSMGAISANVGETLPEGYTAAGTNCSNPDHDHISPDRVVDASACALPDTTFFFGDQAHESTARNDIIMVLATELLAHDDIQDVYSDENFPQFNWGRDTRGLKNGLLPTAKSIDQSTLTEDQAARLNAAIDEAERVLGSTVAKQGEAAQAEANLRAILVELGYAEAKSQPEDAGALGKISLWLYDKFGTNGFSEYPVVSIKKILALFGLVIGG